jgi:hypothetical protein
MIRRLGVFRPTNIFCVYCLLPDSILTYTQTYFQLTAQYLMLLHVSASNRGYILAATLCEDTNSALCNFSALSSELYRVYSYVGSTVV